MLQIVFLPSASEFLASNCPVKSGKFCVIDREITENWQEQKTLQMFINVCPLVIFYAKPFCDIEETHEYVLISEKGFVTRYTDIIRQ